MKKVEDNNGYWWLWLIVLAGLWFAAFQFLNIIYI